MAVDRCHVCEREYIGNSRPRWVCDKTTGLIVGTAHTGCVRGALRGIADATSEFDGAQFWGWVAYAEPTMSRWMRPLWDQPGDELDVAQWERLTRWVQQGKIDAREVVTLASEHVELIRAYRDWLSEAPVQSEAVS